MRRELESRLTAGGQHCPDEATLAAYVDRSLSAAQRAALDSHCAGCGRCQSILAAIARGAVPDDRRNAGAHRWRLYGAIAAAVAGVSIAVSLIGTGRMTAISRKNEMRLAALPSNVKESPPPAELALNQTRPRLVEQQERAPGASASLGEKRSACCTPLKRQAFSGNAPVQSPPSMRNEIGQPSPSEIASPAWTPQSLARGERQSKPQMAARDVAVQSAAPAGEEIAQIPHNIAAPAAAPVAGAPTAPVTDKPQMLGAGPGLESGAGSFAGGLAMEKSSRLRAESASMVSIRTADGVERWRLGQGGTILHREPGGYWQAQRVGAADRLNAGAAPSPSVCWVVGTGGVVLRTTDGVRWQKVASPTPQDLTSVLAADASRATVTSAAGQRFATTDGGKTWHPMM
jgi:hypothetical protein